MSLLSIDLRTDLDLGADFSGVELHVFKRSTPRRMEEKHFMDFPAVRGSDLTEGARLVDIEDVENGSYVVAVRLLDGNGSSVRLRTVLVRLTGNRVVTVLIR